MAAWIWIGSGAAVYPTVVGVGGLLLLMRETQRPPRFAEEFDWVVIGRYEGMIATAVSSTLGSPLHHWGRRGTLAQAGLPRSGDRRDIGIG